MKTQKLIDLKQDNKNFNTHTQKGMGLLEKSMRKFGFVEAGLISEDNVICSGNARQETAVMIGMEDVQIVEIDGTKPVYLRKKGLKSGTHEFHELALALNQTAKENILLDVEVIEAVLEDAVIDEWQVNSYQSKNGNNLKKYDVPEFEDQNSYFNQDSKAPDKQPFILYLPNNFNTKLQKLKKDLTDEEFAEKIIESFLKVTSCQKSSMRH